MTTALRVCVCSVVAILAAARPAAADWHFTPFIGLTLGGSTTFVDLENVGTGRKFGRKHKMFGGSVARMGRGAVGFEGIFAYVPGIFDRGELETIPVTDSRAMAAMGNVVLILPARWNEQGLRPFVSGGFGLLQVVQDTLLDALPIRRNVLGYNVGGGAIGFVSDRVGLRFEARRFAYLRSGETAGFSLSPENLSFWAASAGIVIRY